MSTLKKINDPNFTTMKTSLNTVVRLPRILLSTVVLALIVCSCKDFNVFPVSQDVALGANIDKELRSNAREYPVYADATVREYVQGVVNQLVSAPDIKYKSVFPYRVTIVDDPQTMNAFCTPGGFIYVYTGLLRALDNEASLAAVLGHEIAHAECRHGTERMTKSLGAQILLDMALGTDASQVTKTTANLFTGLALLKNSRDNEEEADAKSFVYLQHSPWYPGSIRYFFEKVNDRNRRGALERWTSTHPLPQDRITACEQRAAAAKLPPPTESQLRSAPYKEMLQRIR